MSNKNDKGSALDDLLSEEGFANQEDEDSYLAPLLEEINCILEPGIKSFVRAVLLSVHHFWSIPAGFIDGSHPPDEYGIGGNVLHTKRVVRTVILLGTAHNLDSVELDCLVAAALIHDITKTAELLEGSIIYDPLHCITVDRVIELVREYDKGQSTKGSNTRDIEDETVAYISRLVRVHQGKFAPIPELYPATITEWIMHFADLVACNIHRLADGFQMEFPRWELKEDT